MEEAGGEEGEGQGEPGSYSENNSTSTGETIFVFLLYLCIHYVLSTPYEYTVFPAYE